MDNMNTAAVVPWTFQGSNVRTVMLNGEPWWVAKDVAEILEYSWKGIATVSHIPEEWRGVHSVQTPSGIQEMLCLSEQGLYFFLNRSDKPKALPFQKWISGSVIPQIRKTGSYSVQKQTASEITRKDLALMILEAEKELEHANKIIQEQEPLVQLAERYLNNPEFIFDIGDIAASITINGKPLGRNTLFRMMREAGYLYHDHCQNHHVKSGYKHLFKVIPAENNGHTFNKVRSNSEGAMLLINKFSQEKSTPETRQKFTLLKAS